MSFFKLLYAGIFLSKRAKGHQEKSEIRATSLLQLDSLTQPQSLIHHPLGTGTISANNAHAFSVFFPNLNIL